MAFFSRPQSSAVKIVRPVDENVKQQSPRKEASQRQCRNILIYGSCKFQDKGCIYSHPPDPPSRPSTPTPTFTAQAVNAPVFVPKLSSPPPSIASPNATSPPPVEYQDHEHDPYDPYSYPSTIDGLTNHMQSFDMNAYDTPSMYDNSAIDPFYISPQPTFIRQPLQYHLYTPPIPTPFNTYFLSSDLREALTRRSEALRVVPVASPSTLPEELQGYHTLAPLEPTLGERRKFGNWFSTVYRATSSADGGAYALRRIENYRLTHQAAFGAIESWARIQHPGIVSVREAFTARAFNDNSLVVAYAFYPGARTLYDTHLGGSMAKVQSIPERVLWSYLVQLASAIRVVHEAGLAVRVIDATKVLLTSNNRVRISSCGVVDVLLYTPSPTGTPTSDPALAQYQADDLTALGRLFLALATLNPTPLPSSHLHGHGNHVGHVAKALETLTRVYSADLRRVLLWLVNTSSVKGNGHKTVGQLFELIGPWAITEMDEANATVDRLEGELMSELENARLVRLLCKFGFINERPEFAREPRWSETGDRYIIKLFRDFVFHQVDEAGNPVVNLSHVLTCLNKLDVGTEERVMLVSRDEQSCLVVSYKEVKSCIEAAFSDLARASSTR